MEAWGVWPWLLQDPPELTYPWCHLGSWVSILTGSGNVSALEISGFQHAVALDDQKWAVIPLQEALHFQQVHGKPWIQPGADMERYRGRHHQDSHLSLPHHQA